MDHPAATAKPTIDVTIREFRTGDETAFRRLNEAWITRYFVLEPKDQVSLIDPQSSILDGGGRIFLAADRGQVCGCCAILRIRPGEFEVVKMAVAESHQGTGIGRKLLETVINESRAAGAKRLYLETNHQLTPAIHLYKSLGFRHIPAERVVPSPYARADVYMELYL